MIPLNAHMNSSEPVTRPFLSFEEERKAAGWADFWRYTELGMYGEQLYHLYSVFPREQVLVFRYRSLLTDPAHTLDKVCAFLSVPTGVLTDLPRENVTVHPYATVRHSAVATARRTCAALTALLPGHLCAGMTDRLEHRPSELSGGQQQRVAVARALASKPAIIFADEPTGNLDSRSGADILGFLQRARRELDQTIVMVTHDPVAAGYADSAIFLADGHIVDAVEAPTPELVLDHMKRLGA